MKVLVTGGAGQVGREIVRRAPTSFVVEVLDSSQLDITDIGAVMRRVSDANPDIIMNAAAYTAVDQAEDEAGRAWAANHVGPANLGLAASGVGAVVFHLSTDYVFAGDTDRPYQENDPTQPAGVYGASKLAGEQALTGATTEALILRTSWVFGSNGRNFVKTMLKLGSEREELRIVADQIGCPTSAASIADCLWQLARHYQQAGTLQWGTYHFSGSPACSWYTFAHSILTSAHKLELIDKLPVIQPITTRDYPTRACRPAYSVLDCSLIHSTFGIAQPDWQRDLAEVLNELRRC